MSADRIASIRARLLNQARAEGVEFQLHLVRYACERFLYRLGESPHRDRCLLKGAGLLALWMDEPYRGTRDIDLRAGGANDEAAVRDLVAEVAAIGCPADGLRFDLETLRTSVIRAEEEYAGVRARMLVWLGNARIHFQVDVGFGDAVVPRAEEHDYPTLLPDVPTPRIRAYRPEMSIAEKFQAMVELGPRNSRMKDFHDIWALSSALDFDGPVLRSAINACFARRGTPWTEESPDALRPAFYESEAPVTRWAAYLRTTTLRRPPPQSFAEVGEAVRRFLVPVRESLVAQEEFSMRWPAGGPWRARNDDEGRS